MPEDGESTWLEKLIQLIMRQTVGSVAKVAERTIKRALRLMAIALAGVTIAVLGVGFLAVGAVKWFSMLMPSWLAWAVVGFTLLLVGIILALATLIGSRF